MIPFVSAAELKDEFEVTGHFYRVRVRGLGALACRSVLEIARRDGPRGKAEAVFVMMNPGSSAPLAGAEPEIGMGAIGALPVAQVPAKPDTTQYQLMRVMRHTGWNRVRVLNISDLREPSSAVFVERFGALEPRYPAHSVFAPARAAELAAKLERKRGAPVVCAWGVSPALDPLIARCLAALDGHSLVGLRKPDTADKYFHPLPPVQSGQRQWVTEMCALLT
ncbi:MAG TPA: hypothetical protein VFF16_05315 [Telluria sp.]|nr:hypothetical protein [Telluria sp.]